LLEWQIVNHVHDLNFPHAMQELNLKSYEKILVMGLKTLEFAPSVCQILINYRTIRV